MISAILRLLGAWRSNSSHPLLAILVIESDGNLSKTQGVSFKIFYVILVREPEQIVIVKPYKTIAYE